MSVLLAEYKIKGSNYSSTDAYQSFFSVYKIDGMSLPLLSLEQELTEYDNTGKAEKVEKIKSVLMYTHDRP